MLSKALALAQQGFHVFPLAAKNRPCIKGYPEHATRDPEQIGRWWARWPNALVGVSTSRYGGDDALLVVDVDAHKNGFLSMLDVEPLPDTFAVNTPRGGAHLFFRVPAPVKQGVDVLGPGIDVRSKGGYVVGLGSATEKGAYTLACPGEVQPAPAWLVQQCGVSTEREQAPKMDTPLGEAAVEWARDRAVEYLKTAPAAEAGVRNDTGFRVAAKLKDLGVPQADIPGLMLEHWQCEPMLDLAEIEHVARSAYEYGGSAPGSANILAMFDVVPDKSGAKADNAQRGKLALLRHAPGSKPPALRLVKGLLRHGGLSLWAAMPDAGKTTVLQDIGLHVAHGRPWLGRKVARGPVLFCAFERSDDVQGRLDAFYIEHPELKPDDAAFYYVNVETRALATNSTAADIVAACADIETATGEKVALVIFDTLAAGLHGDENDSAVIGDYIRASKFVKGETGAHVAIAHHFGKNTSNGPRGHSKLQGDVDAVFELEDGRITSTKLKGAKKWCLHYTCAQVTLGTDEDGDAVTSVVLREATGKALSEKQTDLVAALKDATWIDPPGELGAIAAPKVTTKAQWVDLVVGRYKSRASALGAINDLLAERRDGVWTDADRKYVWLTGSAATFYSSG